MRVKSVKSPIIDWPSWLFWVVPQAMLGCLPWKVIYLLGKIAGNCIYVVSRGRRRVTIEELSLLFGGRFSRREVNNIARRSFENYSKRQMENLLYGRLTSKSMQRLVSIWGLEILDRALERGKGAILLLSHFGSFLLVLPALGFRGYKINQLAGEPHNPSVFSKQIWELRRREAENLPIRVIEANSLSAIFRCLRNNEIVAIAFDGREGTKWIPVRLFERTAYFSPGPISLALKTEAMIIPTFIVREKGDRHQLILESPFELEMTGNKERDLAHNTERFTQVFEKYLLQYPCHFAVSMEISRGRANQGLEYPLFKEE